MLNAGDLDRRITIQRNSPTKDAFGASKDNWADLATVWAKKIEVSDAERTRAAETAAIITTRFQVRWWSLVSDLNPKDRVLYGTLTYDIVAVKELGRREGLEISATARTDQG